MIGSVFHLGGLRVAPKTEHILESKVKEVGTLTVKCLKPGACDGSIFLLKECGGNIKVCPIVNRLHMPS